MVDYMKTSMSMRANWPLSDEDQKKFADFDYVSNKVFEEDLNKAFKEIEGFGDGVGGLSLG